MLSLFRLKDQIAMIVFAPFFDRWTNFQCLRCLWSDISFFIAVMNFGLSGCLFISPYVNVSLLIISVIRAIGWQIFLVQSTSECARWTFWISLNAKIVVHSAKISGAKFPDIPRQRLFRLNSAYFNANGKRQGCMTSVHRCFAWINIFLVFYVSCLIAASAIPFWKCAPTPQ